MPRMSKPSVQSTTKPGRQVKSNRFVAKNGTPPILQETPVEKHVSSPIANGIVRQETYLERLQRLYLNDPLGFVQEVWPWSKEGTELENQEGPDTWQEQVLVTIRDHYQSSTDSLQVAVSSGHGVGKTTLSVWIILWFLTVHKDTQVVVTANAGHQLSTKTWSQLAKWLRMCPLKDFFQWSSTKCSHRIFPETWFASAIPNNEGKPEAFAGTHGEYVCFIMDEASGIGDIIWETIEGSLTSGNALWLAFGNPLHATGRFRQCFAGGRFASMWTTFTVDSRTAKMADKRDIARKLRAYGETSDYFKMRVTGEFPQQGSQQFIGQHLLEDAYLREYIAREVPDPIIIGVDVARYGDDRSVILVRQGAKIIETRTFNQVNTVQLTGYIGETINKYTIEDSNNIGYGKRYSTEKPTVFIDSVGIGAGVVDQCKHQGYKVEEVLSGEKPQDPMHFENKRCEMYWDLKQWLEKEACLEEDKELEADLTNLMYFYNGGKFNLESKEDLRGRGLASTDISDALAFTFARPVAKGRVVFVGPNSRYDGNPFVPQNLRWMLS